MIKPKIPLSKKVIFSAKPYSTAFLNSHFKELKERPEPFLGTLMAEYEQGLLILFLLQSEPYAAGGWVDGVHKALTLHEFFQTLSKLDTAQLSLYESDLIYLKCLLALFQKKPATQATTDLVNIEDFLGRLKQDPGENLLILKKDEEFNFFYFLGKELVEAYFATGKAPSKGNSLEEGMLSYVSTAGVSSPVELLLYSDLKVTSTPDAHQSISDDGLTAPVEHFLRPCPRLILIGPQETVQEITLHKKIFTIGRSSENDLVLNDPAVSRRHVTLRQDGEDYLLQDEKSRNGILVNGKSASTVVLSDGDLIQIGGFNLQFFLGDRQGSVRGGPSVTPRDEPMIAADHHPLDGRVGHQPRGWLEVRSGDLRGTRFEISDGKILIGRGHADVPLKDPKISYQHATIEWTEEGYCYIDHGSTNGSFINGEKVHKRLLASGDMILIGDTTLKVTIER